MNPDIVATVLGAIVAASAVLIYAWYTLTSGAGSRLRSWMWRGGVRLALTILTISVVVGLTACMGGQEGGRTLCSYTTNWSDWAVGAAGWQIRNGQLINTGQSNTATDAPSLLAPQKCQPDTYGVQDYEIDAQVQIIHRDSGSAAFGIDARVTEGPNGANGFEGYSATVLPFGQTRVSIELIGSISAPDANSLMTFDPDTGSHSYRFSVKAPYLSLSVDGAPDIGALDDTYTSPGEVGLWCWAGMQIRIASFKVLAL